ncbi:ABC transporter ATP-binding protein [Bifidobacterium magnum]|uniref:Oligopeptide ABC transporter ATP-binding protein OppD n=1 Tax=Bifidobacterium magnum TaxID=1692 RepID=A0A087BDZ9_9BIFI|nr:ABC transporter ATP-binding protein [Bifidobacterium magnum]KFI69249.1 Oligopeptide ABC transporter ATP-binding protein OppD [Bifidobacterium magnum]
MALECEGLSIDIGGTSVVRDVSLSVGDGERVGLIGSSGSGKSMIVRSVMGLLPPTAHVSGSVRLHGNELAGLDDASMSLLRGSAIGMVFQNPQNALNPVLTVAQQIELPLRLHYDLSGGERRARVLRMLGKVGLPESFADRSVMALSGGQQQRVGIATALVTSPRMIIADEPTTALDATTQRQIVDLLRELVDELGASMLFITHDFAVLSRATTRCYVLHEGRIVESGSTDGILDHPRTTYAKTLVEAAKALSLHVEEGNGDE